MTNDTVNTIYNLLNENKMDIRDLSDTQKDEMIRFCQLQINTKKNKLDVIKKKIEKIKNV